MPAELIARPPAVLLVGGLGTRLRSVVPSAPKPLARLGDSPFLGLLVRQLRGQGIRRLVMCIGYLAEQIESEFGDGREWGVEIAYSKESRPLGTAGAVKLAEPYLSGASEFLVLNGDSFLDLDIGRLLSFHHHAGGIATLAVCEVHDAGRYGTVRIGPDGRVIGFAEKTGTAAPGLINAGVYVFSRSMLLHTPGEPASLERDVFPKVLQYNIYAMQTQGIFVDIGTPLDYAYAQSVVDKLYRAAATPRQ